MNSLVLEPGLTMANNIFFNVSDLSNSQKLTGCKQQATVYSFYPMGDNICCLLYNCRLVGFILLCWRIHKPAK